jgi:hypothetical protein
MIYDKANVLNYINITTFLKITDILLHKIRENPII